MEALPLMSDMKPIAIARVVSCTVFLGVSWSVGFTWALWYARHGKTNLHVRLRGPSFMLADVGHLLVCTTTVCLREILAAAGLPFPCVLSNLATPGATTG